MGRAFGVGVVSGGEHNAALGADVGGGAVVDVGGGVRRMRTIATSASRMKPSAKVGDVVEPVYGERIRPAFDAVNNYRKPGCGAAGR